MKKLSGFTLVELIVVISVIAILSVITLPLLQAGFESFSTQRSLSDANWQARLALARFTRDIRDIPSTSSITSASTNSLTFVDSSGNSVTYNLSSTNLQRNSLTLARGINSLSFAYFGSNGASTTTLANIRYVSMTLNVTQNNTNLTIQSLVNLRNLTI